MPQDDSGNEWLFGTGWVHAFEEDAGGGEVYRPASDDVPLSRRPRRTLTFSRNGTVTIGQAGPADRPVEVRGQWRMDDEVVVITVPAVSGHAGGVWRARAKPPDRLLVQT